MTTIPQEIVQNFEHEGQEVDGSNQESSNETPNEEFQYDLPPQEPHTPEPPKPEDPTPKAKVTPKSTLTKKESTTKRPSISGIPLRLKSATPTKAAKTYSRTPAASQVGSIMNRNTLEVQFINNKKRLMQMHAELTEKQRPLLEMHKSLLRTKKQLEELGKKVVLEDLKIVSLKSDDLKASLDGAGESPAAEAAETLKSSIENVLDSCVKVCKRCFVGRDHFVQFLEAASKSIVLPTEIEAEVEQLKKDKDELEKALDNAIKENDKKLKEVINNWQKAVKTMGMTAEIERKISSLEDTVKQQQKSLQEAEDNYHSLNRKLEEKKFNYEKQIGEMQEKYNKLEEELKKERKSANENLMKSRNFRGRVGELETRAKEAEEKTNEATQKLKQLQEQMRKKEIQWMKEKDDFKKNELLLQQKFSEKQSQFDTRLKDMETVFKSSEQQKDNFLRNYETQMEIKEQEFALLEKERDSLAEANKNLEDKLDKMKKQLEEQVEEKDRQIEELTEKIHKIPAIEYKPSEEHYAEIIEYRQKVSESQSRIDQLNDQITKMQNSLKAHAKLAAALKLEKDNAMKYSNKLREVLQEAKEDLDFKNKTIYKIHEKLVLKEKENEKLQAQLKDYEYECSEFSGDKWKKNRCQICMASVGEKTENSSCVDGEVGKSFINSPQYVSESLIGMSVKKVDHLRARLDNLKKMKLPCSSCNSEKNKYCSWSQQSRESRLNDRLRKQIELRGKLYQILQKHADQSCEDFINLLKLTVSNNGKGTSNHDELKPSNMTEVHETIKKRPRKHISNIEMSGAFNAISDYFSALPICEICDKFNENQADDQLGF